MDGPLLSKAESDDRSHRLRRKGTISGSLESDGDRGSPECMSASEKRVARKPCSKSSAAARRLEFRVAFFVITRFLRMSILPLAV